MSTASQILRDITGKGYKHASLKDSALIRVDCQNTYRRGMIQLTHVEPAISGVQSMHEAALTAIVDLFAVVLDDVASLRT